MSHFDIKLLDKLPLEIRQHIYGHILPDYDEQPKCFIEADLPKVKRDIKSLFHGHTELREEALEYFHTRNTFSMYLMTSAEYIDAYITGLDTVAHRIRNLHWEIRTDLYVAENPRRSLEWPFEQKKAWYSLVGILQYRKSHMSKLVIKDSSLPCQIREPLTENHLLPSYASILLLLIGVAARVEIYPECFWGEFSEYQVPRFGAHASEGSRTKHCDPLVWDGTLEGGPWNMK